MNTFILSHPNFGIANKLTPLSCADRTSDVASESYSAKTRMSVDVDSIRSTKTESDTPLPTFQNVKFKLSIPTSVVCAEFATIRRITDRLEQVLDGEIGQIFS